MEEPLLNVDQIQANIAPGFRFPFQEVIAVKCGESAARTIISSCLPQITMMREAFNFHDERLEKKQAYNFSVASFEAMESDPVWLNVALGKRLLDELGESSAADFDNSFRLGLDRRSFTLGDPRDPASEGHKENWLVGGPENQADIVLILGSSSESMLDSAVGETSNRVADAGGDIIYHERGRRLDGDKEHFGFRDGVSQPGVRGLVSQSPDRYLTPRKVQNLPTGPEWASPGKPLVWPGEFILGYPRQDANDFRKPRQPVANLNPFLKDGSFLVFRRLKQDVRLFREETELLAYQLSAQPGFQWFTPDSFRANVVGRWPDGSLLVRYPDSLPVPSPSDDEMDYFQYANPLPDATLADGSIITGTDGDPGGRKCPFHGHIRKINPRDATTDLGSDRHTLTLRILRRGIPFGPPYDDDPDETDRGLLFICYQSSIRDQFEELTTKWVNSVVNPEPGTNEGFDMVIGQNGVATNRERFCIFQAGNATESVSTTCDWVIPTGGGYFFAPSKQALTNLVVT